MLQMVSHGLIGASLFFLVGATYDRTKTLKLDEMVSRTVTLDEINDGFTAMKNGEVVRAVIDFGI